MYNVRTEPDRTEAAGRPLPSTFLALGDILECYERCYMRVPVPLDANRYAIPYPIRLRSARDPAQTGVCIPGAWF